MDENIQEVLMLAEEGMQMAIDHLERELIKIRAGKASPDMVDQVMVDYYGSMTPVNQVGNVSIADSRTLTITPWEKNMIPVIDKAVRDANLGLNPSSDSDKVIIPIPSLNEQRRKDLVKQAKGEAESAKISIRSKRKDANDQLKKLQKEGSSEDLVRDAESSIQDLTNKFSAKVDSMFGDKETQIMTV